MQDFTKLYRMDLPHRAIAVYIYLADRANKDGICWPSIPTISKDLKLSESTTRSAIGDLRKKDFYRQCNDIEKMVDAAAFSIN